MNTSKGFTLIELMITLTVVGLLASFAIPAYIKSPHRADVDRCFNHITPARFTADLIIQDQGGSATGITVNTLGLFQGTTSTSGSAPGCESVSVSGLDSAVAGDILISGTASGNRMDLARNGANGVWTCTSSLSELAIEKCP